jgi:hypothetical protein
MGRERWVVSRYNSSLVFRQMHISVSDANEDLCASIKPFWRKILDRRHVLTGKDQTLETIGSE